MQRTYIAIDLKSYYASVECMERGLDPMTTNLVVADLSRTEKTICLAVSPSLKAYGISGRARLFEVVERVKEVNAERRRKAGGNFRGEIVTDRYGRKIPKHAHGTANLPRKTSSARSIMDAVLSIYDEKVNPKLSVRRITITANKIVSEDDVPQEAEAPVQFNLFDDIAAQEQQHKEEEIRLERERKIQEAMLGIKKKFGKNAILNGGSYLVGATARERNGQIGGHKA